MDDEVDAEIKPIPEDSFAARCRKAREMIRVSRGAMTRASRMSVGHYNRFELNQRQPTLSIVERIAEGFQKLGLRATASWLAFGEGPKPTRIRKQRVEQADATA